MRMELARRQGVRGCLVECGNRWYVIAGLPNKLVAFMISAII
jgi:hypothetical protein